MLGVHPLTEWVVAAVPQHAHLIQHLSPAHQPEREPVRDDDAPRCEVEPPVTPPADRACSPLALRTVDRHDLLAPTVHRALVE